MKEILTKVEEIIAENYKKYAFYSTENSKIVAKEYVESNKDMIIGILETFESVKVDHTGLYLVVGPHDSVMGDLVKQNGGVTIKFLNDGQVDFVDAIKPYHHAHIIFEGRTAARGEIGCWGNVPKPWTQIRIDGFLQAVVDMIQFTGKSNETAHQRSEMREQKFN